MIITAKTREGIERTISTNDIFDMLESYSELNPNGKEVKSLQFQCSPLSVVYFENGKLIKEPTHSNYIDMFFSFIDDKYKDFDNYNAKYYINDEFDRYVKVSDEGDPESMSTIVEYDEYVGKWMLTINTGGDRPSVVSLWLPTGFIRNIPDEPFDLCDSGVKLFACLKQFLDGAYDINIDTYQRLPDPTTVLKDKEYIRRYNEHKVKNEARRRLAKIKKAEMEERQKQYEEEKRQKAEEEAHIKNEEELKRRRKLAEERLELEEKLREFCESHHQVKSLSMEELRYFVKTADRVAPNEWRGVYMHMDSIRETYKARSYRSIYYIMYFGKKYYEAKLLKNNDLQDKRELVRDAYFEALKYLKLVDIPENFRRFVEECKDVDRAVAKKIKPPKKGNLNHGPDYDVEYTDEELFADEDGYENEIDEEDLKIPYLGDYRGTVLDAECLPGCLKGDHETVKNFLKNNCYDAILVDCFD